MAKFLNAKQQGRLDGFFTVKANSTDKSGGKKEKEAGKGKKVVGGKRKVSVASCQDNEY